MAVGTDRRAKKTACRLDQPLLLQPVSNVMSFTTPDHGPGVDGSSQEPASLQSPMEHIGFRNSLTGPESASLTQTHSSKKRRSSKSKVPGELRRSTSTPHMRNLALATSGELSPTSNKARNKLGYHRTSVACGHCRRRKIRCLLAPEDPQGRCSNCIRLKKECNFFPVEHSMDMQHPSGAVKDLSTGTPTTPVASSPRHLPHTGEKNGDFRPPFHGIPGATSTTPYGYPGESDIDRHHTPTSNGVPVQHPAYPYPPPIETQWPPTTSYLPSSTVAESPNSNGNYWRQSPSTANSVYGSESGVSGVHTPATMSTSSTVSYGHPENHTWGQQSSFQPPPTRSMSYGNIEGLPQQYPGHGLGIQQDFTRRISPYPFPTSIDTSQPASHTTSMSGPTSGPLSAPVLQSHQFYPPAWNSYEQSQISPMQVPGRSMSGQWYGEPGYLDQVQEESGPPMAYGQHGVAQYYSGA